MKKRLLFAALAMMCAGSSFAYEVDDYVFTSTQKLKITSENLVENGNFSADYEGWTDAEGSAVNGEVWGIEPGVGPNGENAIKSLGATEGVAFCRSFELEEGTYIASFQIKGTEAGKTSIGTVSNGAVTISANCADIFINYDGTLAKGVSSADFPVQDVAAAADFTSEWTTVNFYFEIADTLENIHPALVMYFERMATDVMITNIAIHNAEEVYDTRTTDRLMAYAELLMEDANFNTASASGAKTKLQNAINQVKAYMENGQIDSRGSSMETALIGAINNYLDIESTDMSDKFSLDFASVGSVGRGRSFGSQLTNILLNGNAPNSNKTGNWGHIAGEDCLMSAIQTRQYGHTATFTVVNSDFPAGKYFFTAEIRNAYTGSSSWPCPGQTFTLETMCQMSIGETTIDIGPVVGEQYQRFYLVAEVAESGQFTASVYWPGNGDRQEGGAFYIREVSVRAFGDPQEAIERLAAWKAFKAQYDAAVGARNTIVEMQSDANYPWNKAALQEALDTYDPFFHITDGWVSADGEDTRAATTDQLNEWAMYQGSEIPEDEKATYYVVRGYQAAITAVREANKPITDLNAGIGDAQDVMDDGLFSDGDRETFAAAIQTAQNTVDGIKASTSDATSEADAATLVAALETLNAAVEAYKVSAHITPIVDIDFSGTIEEIMDSETGESTYVIKGAAGEMQFPAGAVNPEDPDNTWTFALGYAGEYPDVLHVGGGHLGTVALPEVPTDNDGLRINFDLWVGNLGKSYIDVELFNAGGTRVAGFSFNRYDGAVGYNEFNNEENTGLDLVKYVTGQGSSSVGNAGICIDSNKSSFTLDVDYKAGLIYGNVTNGRNGTCKGARIALPMPADEDNKIVSFAVGCDANDGTQTYTKSNSGAYARRCWFDNLIIYKYASVAGEQQGIETIAAERVAEQGIFNLQGQKVQTPAKGLYIINGKKYIVK